MAFNLPPPGDTLPPAGRGIATRPLEKLAQAQPEEGSPLVELRDPPIVKSIAEWDGYIHFIEKQIAEKAPNNLNLKSLSCKREGFGRNERITYMGSSFDDKRLETIESKYTEPMKHKSKEALTNQPSLLQVFQDPGVKFWPKVIVFTNAPRILGYFRGVEGVSLESAAFTERLYNEEFDEILEAIKGNVTIRLDIEKYKGPLAEIFEETAKKPVCISAFASDLGQGGFHGIACVAYRNAGKLFVGVYDPMFFQRPGKVYTWALTNAYLIVKLVALELGVDVTLLNLSGLCLTTKKGVHCAQYIINAEFCLPYSIYFLYLYTRAGTPKTTRGLRRVVEETYIVSPVELGRAPCAANKRFRLVILSFILTLWMLNVKNEEYLGDIGHIADGIKGEDGFDLLAPDVRALIPESKIVPLGSGGARRRATRRALYKRPLRRASYRQGR